VAEGHAIYESKPSAVADLIEEATRSAAR